MQRHSQQDQDSTLESLLSYLETAYYNRIEVLCEKVELNIAELNTGEESQAAALYISLSKKLLGQVKQYIRLRRFALLPYIHELLDKEDSGHDCRSCSTSCSIRHTAQISGIKEAHNKIKESLYRLQSVAVPIYQKPVQADAYFAMRNEMMLMDTTLTELFYLEESSLIPKVIEAQKNIHAHS